MGAHVLSMPDDRRDNLRGMVALSAILHVALVGLAAAYSLLGFHFGNTGAEWGLQSAVHINSVASLPGIPLPTPAVQTPTTVATQTPMPAKPEEQEKPQPPPPDAQQIPKFKDAVKPEKVERVNKHIPQPTQPPPDNAVPGQGEAEMNYTQSVVQGGNIAASAGEGNSFGQRYAWYVASMCRRISGNWLQSTISSNISSAQRMYFTFAIERDGTIKDIDMTQGSGVPEVDRSGLRAILASSPLPALPPDYAGSSVNVQFYFDFHRQ